LRAILLHISIDLQSFMFSRLKWIWTGDFRSERRSKWILFKEWFKMTSTKVCKTPIMLPSFRLIKLARSTLIFLKHEPNWIRKKIQLKRILWLPKLSKLLSPKTRKLICKLMNSARLLSLKNWETPGISQSWESNSGF